MVTLRQILILLILALVHPYGKSQASYSAKDIAGIWSMPFSYKHEEGFFQGRFYLDLEPDSRLRLIETVKIGERPDAFFARYNGTWSYDGSVLKMSVRDDAEPMFAREVRNELRVVGADVSFVDALENAFKSSLPSVDKLGLSREMTIRDLGPKKLVLASSSSNNALALQREAALPEVGRFKFSQSEAMEAKLSGSWIIKLDNGQHMITLDPKTQRLNGVFTFNDDPGKKAEYVMSWQASERSIQLKYNDPAVHLTRYGEEISDLSVVNQELILTFKRQAAMSQVFGIAVDVSGNRLNMTDLDGSCLVWNRVAGTGGSSRKDTQKAGQTTRSTSNAKQSSVSMETNSESNSVKEVVAESAQEEKLNEAIYTSVEQKPQFPGGEAALLKWVSEHICYPDMAEENNFQGRVVVEFVVTKTGEIGEVKVLRSKGPDIDKEAVRVVKSLPAFVPGKMNGQPVNVWYTLPVTFRRQGI